MSELLVKRIQDTLDVERRLKLSDVSIWPPQESAETKIEQTLISIKISLDSFGHITEKI